MSSFMKVLVTISRILVGSLFIVSGLIKANDTLGFSYKLVEYFEPAVLDMTWMIPYAWPLAIFICVVEVVLGLATLLGGKMRLTAWSLMLLIVFFTFLTFYSAYYEKVTECGCFGDAIKLTPWQSFYKDLALLFFIIIIFIKQAKIEFNTALEDRIILPISVLLVALFSVLLLKWNFPWIFTLLVLAIALVIKTFMDGNKAQWTIALWATVASSFFCYYTIAHLPIRDFRPYAVGKNILEQMKTAEELGLKAPEYASMYILKNNETGKNERVLSTVYLKVYADSIDKNKDGIKDMVKYTYVDAEKQQIKLTDGYEPPIKDFAITDQEGNDITFSVLDDPNYYFFVISYDITQACGDPQKELNDLYKKATAAGVKVYGLTASDENQIQEFKHKHQSFIDYYPVDGIVLKTMIRANPGIMLLKKGTVLGSWHYNDLPEFGEIKKELMK